MAFEKNKRVGRHTQETVTYVTQMGFCCLKTQQMPHPYYHFLQHIHLPMCSQMITGLVQPISLTHVCHINSLYLNVVLPCRRHGVPLNVLQLDTDRPVEQPKTGSERAKHSKTSQFQLSVRTDRFSPATTAPPTRAWLIGGIWRRTGQGSLSRSGDWLFLADSSLNPLALLKLNDIVSSVLMIEAAEITMIWQQQWRWKREVARCQIYSGMGKSIKTLHIHSHVTTLQFIVLAGTGCNRHAFSAAIPGTEIKFKYFFLQLLNMQGQVVVTLNLY